MTGGRLTYFLEQVDHLEHLANLLKEPKVFNLLNTLNRINSINRTKMFKLTFLGGGRLETGHWRRGQRVKQVL